jgi:hypothetical protein
VPEGLHGLRQVDHPGLGAGLAHLERLEAGEILAARVEQVGEPAEQQATGRAVQPPPGAILERGAGGAHRQVDGHPVGLGDRRERALGHRVDHVECLESAARKPAACHIRHHRDPAGQGLGVFSCRYARLSFSLTDSRTVRDVCGSVKEGHRPGRPRARRPPWLRVSGPSRGIIESCQAHRYQVKRAAW